MHSSSPSLPTSFLAHAHTHSHSSLVNQLYFSGLHMRVLFPSLSPPPFRVRMCNPENTAGSRDYSHSHTHTLSLSLSHTHTHTLTLTHTLSLSLSHTHTHSHSHSHSLTDSSVSMWMHMQCTVHWQRFWMQRRT